MAEYGMASTLLVALIWLLFGWSAALVALVFVIIIGLTAVAIQRAP